LHLCDLGLVLIQYVTISPNREELIMKRVLIPALLSFFICGFLQTGSVFAADYSQGKTVYEKNCQICHGPKGDGKGPAAASLSPHPADFAQPVFWKKTNDTVIADTIKNGKGEMPSFDLSKADLQAVIDYLHHAFEPKTK
jgi:mono/diheme cytochrome c family protein